MSRSANPILITGAGRRVGLHLARRLTEAGQPVLLHVHTPTPEAEALGEVIAADLGDPAGALGLVEAVKRRTRSLRAIVHNASLWSPTEREPRAAIEQFEGFFRIHMLAPWLLNEGLAELLRASPERPADIVHLTDITAERPRPEYDLYCATKAALANLTRSFARRYAPDIKVNAIAPGPILFKGHSEEQKRKVLEKTPFGVEGGPEAIYLALRGILDNHYLTGVQIPVDGGRSLAE